MHKIQICNVGVMEEKPTSQSILEFHHRTYAEFLLAEVVADTVTDSNQIPDDTSFPPIDFDTILNTTARPEYLLRSELNGIKSRVSVSRFNNSSLAYFINGHLERKLVAPQSLVHADHFRPKLDNMFWCNALFSCASANLLSLFKIIINMHKDKYSCKIRLPLELLLAAVTYSDSEFVDSLLQIIYEENVVELNIQSSEKCLVSPMQIAVQRGSHAIVQRLLRRESTTNSWMSDDLLHVCVSGSAEDQPETITDKLDLIDLLLTRFPERGLLEKTLEDDDSTPILQSNTNTVIIHCLLKNKANVNAVTNNGETVLHKFLSVRDRERIKEAELVNVLTMLNNFKFTGYNSTDYQGETPLAKALSTATVTNGALGIFKERNTNFKFKNKCGDNLLFIATRNQQPEKCLELLIKYKVDVMELNFNNESILHVAADIGYLRAVQMFLGLGTGLVNSQDVNGNAPLHLAFANGSQSHYKIQNELLSARAKFVVTNCDGLNPLEYGLQHSMNLVVNVGRLEEFKDQGYQVTERSSSRLLHALLMNEGAISWDISKEFGGLLWHLIEKGGHVRFDNNEKKFGLFATLFRTTKTALGYINFDNEDIPTEQRIMDKCIVSISKYIVSADRYNDISKRHSIKHEKAFERVVSTMFNEREKHLAAETKAGKLSMELAILCLLKLNDEEMFRRLLKAYRFTKSKTLLFKDTELAEFYQENNATSYAIFTDTIPLTVAKVQEQISPSILVVDSKEFKNCWRDMDSDVLVIAWEPDIFSCLPLLTDYPHTVLYVLQTTSQNIVSLFKDQAVAIFIDKCNWMSMSSSLRNELQENVKNRDDWVKKSLCVEMNSNAVPKNFLIPKHVKAALKDILDSNIESAVTPEKSALVAYALTKSIPNLKDKISSSSTEVSTRNKICLSYGPTRCYLAARYLLRNMSMLSQNQNSILEIIFDSDETTFDFSEPFCATKQNAKTYVFKCQLVNYFLDQLVFEFSISNCVELPSHMVEKTAHSCINLNAPNLLNLFSNNFSFDLNIYRLAAERGNLHSFHRLSLLDLNRVPDIHNVWRSLLSSAIQGVHLKDIVYIVPFVQRIYNAIKFVGDKFFIVKYYKANSHSDTDDILARKLFALEILCETGVLTSSHFHDSLVHTKNVHPLMLILLSLKGANLSLCSDSTVVNFLQKTTNHQSEDEFHRCMKSIVINGYTSELLETHYIRNWSQSPISMETMQLFGGRLSDEESSVANCTSSKPVRTDPPAFLNGLTLSDVPSILSSVEPVFFLFPVLPLSVFRERPSPENIEDHRREYFPKIRDKRFDRVSMEEKREIRLNFSRNCTY